MRNSGLLTMKLQASLDLWALHNRIEDLDLKKVLPYINYWNKMKFLISAEPMLEPFD